MAIQGIMESAISNSEIFQGLNKWGNENQRDKAIKIINSSNELVPQDLETFYYQVKQFPDPLSRAAVDAFTNGSVKIVFNEMPEMIMSQAIPFLTFLRGSEPTTYIFGNKLFLNKNKEGGITAKTGILLNIISAATISNHLKKNYHSLSSNYKLFVVMMNVYTRLVCRILNKEYRIIPDKIVYDIIQYYINKFFGLRIYELITDENQTNLEQAASAHFKYIEQDIYQDIKAKYNKDNPENITQLLELLKTTTPRMKTLTMASFVSKWIDYYFLPSMLAIDNIEYLILLILSLLKTDNYISIAGADAVKESKNIKAFKELVLSVVNG